MKRIRVHILFCMVAVSLTSVTGLNEELNDIEKRAPLGFQGMRGKKSDTYSDNSIVDDLTLHPNDIAPPDMIDKRAPTMGFQGMRGKKLYKEDYSNSDNFYELKRAPMGFQGMRGKKDMEILNAADLSPFDKRAPSAGFMGVRGKKENDDRYLVQGYDLEGIPFVDQFNDNYDKRAPMGFQGMRGKKAPIASFFGVRGKKHPVSSSFFGMRGKKYPYEFRGKFVGVRGKKDNHDIEIDDSEITNESSIYRQPDNVNDLNLNQLMLLLSENQERNEIPWIKRAGPNGFFGVRGKKNNEEN